MKMQRLSLVFAALALTVGASADAQVRVRIGVNPFVFGGYPPPMVYQPDPYYYPPPVVYLGGRSWGDRRGGHGEREGDRHDDRGRRR
jgi:hypothetical protein